MATGAEPNLPKSLVTVFSADIMATGDEPNLPKSLVTVFSADIELWQLELNQTYLKVL